MLHVPNRLMMKPRGVKYRFCECQAGDVFMGKCFSQSETE